MEDYSSEIARRLTDRQLAVLAAVERIGSPTIPELASQFADLPPSAVWSVVAALEKYGRVAGTGDRHWRYLGDTANLPADVDVPRIPDDAAVRVSSMSPPEPT